jgi:RNA polymerase-binding protein DksA
LYPINGIKENPNMAGEKKKKDTAKAVSKTVSAGKGADKEVKPKKAAPQKAVGQAFVKKMEKSLLDLKSEIINNLVASNNDFKEMVEGMDPKDVIDVASDDIDRKMIEALGSQEVKRLNLIDSALARIKEGKYGHCIKCSKPIPADRLEAIPYALMCIDCKSEEERRNR